MITFCWCKNSNNNSTDDNKNTSDISKDNVNKCNDMITILNHRVEIFGLISIMVLQRKPVTLFLVPAITRNNNEFLSIESMGINSFVQISPWAKLSWLVSHLTVNNFWWQIPWGILSIWYLVPIVSMTSGLSWRLVIVTLIRNLALLFSGTWRSGFYCMSWNGPGMQPGIMVFQDLTLYVLNILEMF